MAKTHYEESQACYNYLKFLAIFLNILYTIAGLVLIVLGSFGIKWLHDLRAPAIFVLVVGVAIVLVAVCGFIGVGSHYYCLLVKYIFSLVVLFVLQTSAAIVLFVVRNKVDDALTSHNLKNSLQDYSPQSTEADLWNNYQKQFKCCGVDSYSDWQTLAKQQDVPKSCCIERITNCRTDFPLPSGIYTSGCVKAVRDYVRKAALIIGAVVAGVAAFEIIVIGVAAGYLHSMPKQTGYGKM